MKLGMEDGRLTLSVRPSITSTLKFIFEFKHNYDTHVMAVYTHHTHRDSCVHTQHSP